MTDITLYRPACSALDFTRDPNADKTPGMRLYRSSPGVATLQIRSVGSTSPRRGGATKHIVSGADLDVTSAGQLIRHLQIFVANEKRKES